MANYLGGFSLDKIASTLNNAAQKTQQKLSQTQEQITSKITSINIDDTQALLKWKSKKHQIHEYLGTIRDASKLPPEYLYLEKKCDSYEKVCRKLLVVTKTFEVEGYDYPPNLSEYFSDWWGGETSAKGSSIFWGFGKTKNRVNDNSAKSKSPVHASGEPAKVILDSEFYEIPASDDRFHIDGDETDDNHKDAAVVEAKETTSTGSQGHVNTGGSSRPLSSDKNAKPSPPSFAQALAKAAKESVSILSGLIGEHKDKAAAGNAASTDVTEDNDKPDIANVKTSADAKEEEEEQEEEEEGIDEEIDVVIGMFESWSKAQQTISEAKIQMDQFMAKEFNKKLNDMIDTKFEKAHQLRRKVEDSRLKFDTLRYELESKKPVTKTEGNQDEEATDKNDTPEKPDTTTKQESNPEALLFQKLEDEFVSNTTEAVEFMAQITDSAEIISLVKLFHKFQLIYHRQCVQEIQESLNSIELLVTEEIP